MAKSKPARVGDRDKGSGFFDRFSGAGTVNGATRDDGFVMPINDGLPMPTQATNFIYPMEKEVPTAYAQSGAYAYASGAYVSGKSQKEHRRSRSVGKRKSEKLSSLRNKSSPAKTHPTTDQDCVPSQSRIPGSPVKSKEFGPQPLVKKRDTSNVSHVSRASVIKPVGIISYLFFFQ